MPKAKSKLKLRFWGLDSHLLLLAKAQVEARQILAGHAQLIAVLNRPTNVIKTRHIPVSQQKDSVTSDSPLIRSLSQVLHTRANNEGACVRARKGHDRVRRP